MDPTLPLPGRIIPSHSRAHPQVDTQPTRAGCASGTCADAHHPSIDKRHLFTSAEAIHISRSTPPKPPKGGHDGAMPATAPQAAVQPSISPRSPHAHTHHPARLHRNAPRTMIDLRRRDPNAPSGATVSRSLPSMSARIRRAVHAQIGAAVSRSQRSTNTRTRRAVHAQIGAAVSRSQRSTNTRTRQAVHAPIGAAVSRSLRSINTRTRQAVHPPSGVIVSRLRCSMSVRLGVLGGDLERIEMGRAMPDVVCGPSTVRFLGHVRS